MAFNLKKHAQATQEQRLQEQRDHYNTETKLPTSPTDQQLKDLHKNDNQDTPPAYEGLLDEARTKEEYNKTIEGQMDDHEVSADLPKRTGEDKHDQLPINLLGAIRDKERDKAYEKATVKDADTERWDKLLGVDEPLKAAPSQLANHPDRFSKLTDEDVLKNKNVKELVMASLRDADAMLYFIHHKAASEGRRLSDKEQKLVDGITTDKTKLAAMILSE